MKKPTNGVVIDGFVRSPHISGSVPRISAGVHLAGGTAKIKAAAQNVHKRTQRSQTLMRHVVKKPQLPQKTDSPELHSSKQEAATNSNRLIRAQAVVRNSKVNRFGHVVAAKPQTHTPSKIEAIVPDAKRAQRQQAESKPVKPMPSMVVSASHKQLERMLDQALYRADAHKKARNGDTSKASLWQKIKNAPKWVTISTAVLAVGLLAGFYAWQNIPQVAMRVAATRANVNASVPGYVPPGFSFSGPIEYNNGAVTIKFKANDSGSREFVITQKKSDMSSKSLADSTLPENTQVQTAQVAGTTIYIFGERNDAVWVNQGVEYKLSDSASLNSDQILKIADSL